MAKKNTAIKIINNIYSFFLSDSRKKDVEKVIFITAIIAFILHLILIALANTGVIPYNGVISSNPLNLLSAIYTPFTIILLYEIYSLIYYLPKSLTIYLGKQYEIIVLILIRKTFYDLSNLSITDKIFESNQIQELMITFISLLIFFLLIFFFYKLSDNKYILESKHQYSVKRINYIMTKKIIAIGLMILFIVLFIWSLSAFQYLSPTVDNTIVLLKQMNNTFFNIFFTALILTEVLILLLSFNLAEQFHKIMRNSGFIISTILLKLSFTTEKIPTAIIIFCAIAFGVAILAIYRLFEKKLYNGRNSI